MIQQFSIPSKTVNMAQIAFLMLINEYSRNCAKGEDARSSWVAAINNVLRLGLESEEEAGYNDLIQKFIESDEFIETEFWLGGRKQTARVIAYRFTEYPTVV